MLDTIVIINHDDRLCRTLARHLRAEHYYCRVLSADAPLDEILQPDVRGIIIATGLTDAVSPEGDPGVLADAGVPLLAIGDAALALCTHLGGQLCAAAPGNDMLYVTIPGCDDVLMAGVQECERSLPFCRYMTLTDTMRPLAASDDGILAFRSTMQPLYGIGFLPETHDMDYNRMVTNFCGTVCGCEAWWSAEKFIDQAEAEIRQAVGDEGEALLAVSGGSDSTVCAAIARRALGSRIRFLFIETGLLRKNEREEVLSFLHDRLDIGPEVIDISADLLPSLTGVIQPAEKERIIYQHMQQAVDQALQQLPNVHVFLQSTNFTDLMNHGSGDSIRLSRDDLRIVCPLRELFKDEIRMIGMHLSLPESLCLRQPFPGSGLALRVLGFITPESLQIVREADAIFRESIESEGLEKRLWHYYAIAATYQGAPDVTIILRAVQAQAGNGSAARLPGDFLDQVTARIMRELPVRRVMYELSPSLTYRHFF